MDYDKLIKRPLETEYVNGILEKLNRTFEKYELVIPEVENMLRDIVVTKPNDHFSALMIIIETLMKYKTASPFMDELAKHVKTGFSAWRE